jgi:glucosamine--fructose-6-phosphate aminotransferase (isomerizing)
MDRKEPELILDQLKTHATLHSRELPNLIQNPSLDIKKSYLKSINTVYAIGDGDSLCAAQAAAYGFKKISGINFVPVPALDFLLYILPFLEKRQMSGILLAGISASGGSSVVIKAIRECRGRYPAIKTISISGKKDSPLEKEAEYAEPVQMEELGRSPGIRTYAASLAGLFSIACSIGESKGLVTDITRNTIAQFLKNGGDGAAKTIEQTLDKGKELAELADGPFIFCIGTGPDQGTASFSGAKIVEASGVYAAGQDLEEWNHLESFSYPLDTAMIVFANPGAAFKKAAVIIKSGKALGHRVIAVNPDTVHDFDGTADAVIPVFGPYNPFLAPFTQYLPGTVLAYCLARKHGRAMFMSDRS